MEMILERYERYCFAERKLEGNAVESQGSWSVEYAKLKARNEVLQRNQRHYMGEDLENLSLKELHNLEHQLCAALKHIRSRKNQLIFESIAELQKKDKALQEQNNMLAKKVKEKEEEQAQQVQLGQQNQHDLNSSSLFMSQSLNSLNISETCDHVGDTNLAEGTPCQNQTIEVLPPWMLRHMMN